jgi:cell division septum initiation protein DivIVA
MVIQQIEQAGVATLQETATTVASRFASIKMTLLSIHGAFAVKSVQQIAGRQAQLDRQLTELRGRALKDVAVSAALAPGDNRVAQAEQIERIIATTKEVHGLVEAARKTTDEKFEVARAKFAAARQELATLSAG